MQGEMSEPERFYHGEKLLKMTLENLSALRAKLNTLTPQTPMTEAHYLALERLAKLIGNAATEAL